MEPDNFEQQLQRQTIRKIPETWRSQVLSAAQRADESKPWRTALNSLKAHVVALLWPSPKAWVGLATVWLVIALINVKTGDRRVVIARTPGATRELVIPWKDQERLLSEAIHFQESPDSAPQPSSPTPVPRPRSERRNDHRVI
jgi:hypothetical protein